MLCPKCGADVGSSLRLCKRCETPSALPQSQFGMPPDSGVRGPAGTDTEAFHPAEELIYGGFWLRVLASFLDLAFLALISATLYVAVCASFGFDLYALGQRAHHAWQVQMKEYMTAVLVRPVIYLLICEAVAVWLYFAGFEASRLGGTPGKTALALIVIRENGPRLSFFRATVRFLARLLSLGALGVGFIMAAFTPKKRALHDLIAGTVVIRGNILAGARVAVVSLSILFYCGVLTWAIIYGGRMLLPYRT